MNLTWLQFSFVPYAKRMGLAILKDDIKFIERTLPNFPEARQKVIMKQYIEVWMSKATQGEGRRAANTFLRELSDMQAHNNLRVL